MSDVQTYPAGSVIGFRPVSQSAKDWFADNVASDGWQWLGSVLYIEHRYADDLLSGLLDAGFEVT